MLNMLYTPCVQQTNIRTPYSALKINLRCPQPLPVLSNSWGDMQRRSFCTCRCCLGMRWRWHWIRGQQGSGWRPPTARMRASACCWPALRCSCRTSTAMRLRPAATACASACTGPLGSKVIRVVWAPPLSMVPLSLQHFSRTLPLTEPACPQDQFARTARKLTATSAET